MSTDIEFKVYGRNLTELEDAAAKHLLNFVDDHRRSIDYNLEVYTNIEAWNGDIPSWTGTVRAFIADVPRPT